ncbi:MAG: hypothetical protein ACOVT5_12040 [Armatimonadaceae bacterium]
MEGFFLLLACLIPVLAIGALLVDLLLRDAPRRGKRPDLGTPKPERLPAPGNRVCAVAADGQRVVGTALRVARHLGLRVWSNRDAMAGLDRMVDDGRLVGWTCDRDRISEPLAEARLRR